ncbi:MAG TPA: fused MFS/spermidine synthase [Chloroflexota bacterium]|nr:fused MFS/spermidine synthase [Chloroflexota bacterium]
MLFLLVVVAGMASLSVEMAASRLLAPFFGSSLYSWAILIGLILLYLTLGYWLGGKLADSRPSRRPLFALNAIAALAVALVAVLATPVLDASLTATERWPFGLFWGTIAGCLALFTVPTILLGCVSPYAIRLSLARVSAAGNAAGTVFALTTIGSLIGTFSAVFLLIPSIGTRATLYVFAATLLVASLLGLVVPAKTKHLE